MTEPKCHFPKVVGCPEHGDGAGVPKLVRRHCSVSHAVAGLCGGLDMLFKDVFEAIPRHGCSGGIDEEFRDTHITAHSQPSPQFGRRFFPERQTALPSPFPTDGDAWRAMQRYVGQRKTHQFRDAQATCEAQVQHCAVADAESRCRIRRVEYCPYFFGSKVLHQDLVVTFHWDGPDLPDLFQGSRIMTLTIERRAGGCRRQTLAASA